MLGAALLGSGAKGQQACVAALGTKATSWAHVCGFCSGSRTCPLVHLLHAYSIFCVCSDSASYSRQDSVNHDCVACTQVYKLLKRIACCIENTAKGNSAGMLSSHATTLALHCQGPMRTQA